MIYTVDQLIADLRSDLYDVPDSDDDGNERDALWSSEDLLRYINSAAARWASDTLALRRRLVFDTTPNSPLVRVPYDEIIEVLAVSFTMLNAGRTRRLVEFGIDTGFCLDDYGSTSAAVPDLDATGVPTHFSRDHDDRFMRLWRVPWDAGVLAIDAYVLPQQIMRGMPLPFTAMQDRDLVLMWAKKMAYEKQDADTLDLSRAKEFEAQYRAYMPDRKSEIDRIRRDGGIVRPA